MALLHFSSPTSYCSLSCQRCVAPLMATAELPVRHCPPLHLHSYSQTQILTSHNETKSKRKLCTTSFKVYLKKKEILTSWDAFLCSPNNFVSYVYLYLQDKQKQIRQSRCTFSIKTFLSNQFRSVTVIKSSELWKKHCYDSQNMAEALILHKDEKEQ